MAKENKELNEKHQNIMKLMKERERQDIIK